MVILYLKSIISLNKSLEQNYEKGNQSTKQNHMKRSRQFQIESFEEQWTCPITSMPMIDPVITIDGHSYQKNDIQEWLKKQQTSPKTGLQLITSQTYPNRALKNVISKFQNQFKYQFSKLCNQNTQLHQQQNLFDKKIKHYINETKTIQNQYNQIKTKYSQLVSNSKRVGQSFLSTRKENEELKAQNKHLVGENKSFKVDATGISMVKSQNAFMKQQTNRQMLQISAMKSQIQVLLAYRSQNITLKAESQIIKLQNMTLKGQNVLLMPLRVQNQTLKSQNQSTKILYYNLQQKLLSIEALIDKLKEQAKSNGKNIIASNEVERFKLQASRYKIQNHNLKEQVKKLFQELTKSKLDHERLKNLHSFCTEKNKQEYKLTKRKLDSQPSQREKMQQQGPVGHFSFDKLVQNHKALPKYEALRSDKDLRTGQISNAFSKKQQYIAPKLWSAPQIKADRNNPQKYKPDQVQPLLRLVQILKQQANTVIDKTQDKKQLTAKTQSFRNLLKQGTNNILDIKQKQRKGVSQIVHLHHKEKKSAQLLNPFHYLISQSVQPKIAKIQAQEKSIKFALPYQDYILHNPVLYDQTKQQLDHSGHVINAQEFLKYNWSHLKTLNLSDTELNDNDFQLLTNQAIYFIKLQNLWLWNNFLTNIPKFALERFKQIKTVFFSIKGRYPNPLTQQSKNYLRDFRTRYPNRQISYENNVQ